MAQSRVMPNPIDVRHNEDEQRFEAEVNGGVAVIEYNRGEGIITFLHTEVPEAASGQGVASALARAALDYARDSNLSVVALCDYVSSYMKRHSEYEELRARR